MQPTLKDIADAFDKLAADYAAGRKRWLARDSTWARRDINIDLKTAFMASRIQIREMMRLPTDSSSRWAKFYVD